MKRENKKDNIVSLAIQQGIENAEIIKAWKEDLIRKSRTWRSCDKCGIFHLSEKCPASPLDKS